MIIAEYIESGILDVYVLKGLSPQEELEVETLARQHPEIAEEITRIQFTLEQFALDTSISPSVSVKKQLFEKIASEELNKQSDYSILKETNEKRAVYLYFAIAASWLIAIVAGGFAFFYHHQWKSAENKVLALQSQQKEMADVYNLTKSEAGRMAGRLNLLSDTALKLVALKNVPTKQGYSARVFWSATTGEVLLSAQLLPKAPEGKQFQLWAIVDGKPVDAGVVPVSGAAELIKMKDISGASAFAITLEKEGGSPVPDLAEMVVMGGV